MTTVKTSLKDLFAAWHEKANPTNEEFPENVTATLPRSDEKFKKWNNYIPQGKTAQKKKKEIVHECRPNTEIDDAMDMIASANGVRVEIETNDPRKLAAAIRARLQRDGIRSYSIAQDEYSIHVFKTPPPRIDRKRAYLKGKRNG